MDSNAKNWGEKGKIAFFGEKNKMTTNENFEYVFIVRACDLHNVGIRKTSYLSKNW